MARFQRDRAPLRLRTFVDHGRAAQPGMLAPPLQLTLRLPAGARIESASIPLIENAGAWTAQLDLRLDLSIEVVFSEN